MLPQPTRSRRQALQSLQARLPWLRPVDEELTAAIRSLTGELGGLAAQALTFVRFALRVFRGLLAILLVLVVALYLVLDREAIRDYVLDFAPEGRRRAARELLDRMARRTGGWLLGQLVLMTTVGVLSYVGLSAIGVPFAVLLAVLAAFGEVVPIVGPIVTGVPAVALAATVSLWHAGAAVALYLAIQQVESYLLAPKIMHHAVKIHPLAVLLAVLFGTELWGVLGALLAVPAAASAAVLLDELKSAKRQGAPSAPSAADTADGADVQDTDAERRPVEADSERQSLERPSQRDGPRGGRGGRRP